MIEWLAISLAAMVDKDQQSFRPFEKKCTHTDLAHVLQCSSPAHPSGGSLSARHNLLVMKQCNMLLTKQKNQDAQKKCTNTSRESTKT